MKTNQENPPEIFPTENMPKIPTREEHCDTAVKYFSCLNFPLEAFTRGNQKTALIEKNLAAESPTDPVESKE